MALLVVYVYIVGGQLSAATDVGNEVVFVIDFRPAGRVLGQAFPEPVPVFINIVVVLNLAQMHDTGRVARGVELETAGFAREIVWLVTDGAGEDGGIDTQAPS